MRVMMMMMSSGNFMYVLSVHKHREVDLFVCLRDGLMDLRRRRSRGSSSRSGRPGKKKKRRRKASMSFSLPFSLFVLLSCRTLVGEFLPVDDPFGQASSLSSYHPSLHLFRLFA